MITTLLQNAKSGDKNAMEQLIRKFSGLLHMYAKKLNYEDALNDMILQFIEVIYRISVDKLSIQSEGAIIKYICHAMKNEYVRILTKHVIPAKENGSLEFALLVSGSFLTDYQRTVLWGIFYYGYSVSEIARKTKTSRQAVNQAKKRALERLKRNLI